MDTEQRFEFIRICLKSKKQFKKDFTQFWTEFFQIKNDQEEQQETTIKDLMK